MADNPPTVPLVAFADDPATGLARPGPEPERLVAEPGRLVKELLAVARRRLRMDVAWLARAHGDEAVVEAADGDWDSFGLCPGTTVQAEDSFFPRVIAGDLPEIVRDVRAHRTAAGLPPMTARRAGSYAMTPVFERDGTFYGMVGALAHDARPDLQDRDIHFLRLAAEVVADSVSDLRRVWSRRWEFWEQVSEVIDAGGPVMVFQPIVDLARANRVVAVEALARFPLLRGADPSEDMLAAASRERSSANLEGVMTRARAVIAERAGGGSPCRGAGAADPERWFACAATVGLGGELELAAVANALDVLPELPADVLLSVNVSLAAAGAALLDTVRDVEPRRLLLEITEHDRLDEGSEAFEVLRLARARGIRIGADDVGTGYAGLAQLLALRPDVVKMDRYLTHGIDADPARRATTLALLQVAQEIGAVVLAEGVETEKELRTLRATGVRLGQGNHLARPVGLRDVRAAVRPS